MVTGQIIIILIIAGLTVFALFRTLHESVSGGRKKIYIALRCLVLLLLIIVLVEPIITVKRFPSRNHAIPVLIDVSESMRIFAIDSILVLMDSYSTSPPLQQTGRKPFSYYSFGDSLRRYDRSQPFSCNDRRSYLPSITTNKELNTSNEVIIISDGCWSNASGIMEDLTDKSIRFVPLTPFRQQSYLRLTVPDSLQCSSETSLRFTLHCEGLVSQPGSIKIFLFNNDQSIAGDSILVEAGGFSHEFTLQVPPIVPGVHIHRVTAIYTPVDSRINKITAGPDTNASKAVPLSDTHYFLRHARAQSFRYVIISDTPSIDMRFLKETLLPDPSYSEIKPSAGEKPDVAFIFNNTESSQRLSPGTLPVYLGCAPQKTAWRKVSAPISLFANDRDHSNPFTDLNFSEFPPLSSFFMGPAASLRIMTPYISGVINRDTVALVYQGIYRNHSVLVSTFRNFWQWDFLPLSHTSTGESDIFPFTRRFIATVTDILSTLSTDTMLIFPLPQPVEYSPVRLGVVLPYAVTSLTEKPEIICRVRNSAMKTIVDTVIAVDPSRSLLKYLQLPPCTAGTYEVTCSLATEGLRSGVLGNPSIHNENINRRNSPIPGQRSKETVVPTQNNRRLVVSCDFEVTPDRSECLVNAQNKTILREIGQVIDLKDTRQMDMLIRQHGGTYGDHPLAERIFLKRSWLLLGGLLLLFLTEWILRRIDGLD